MNDLWAVFSNGLRENPKVKALAPMLGLSLPTACGHLGLFWAWAVNRAIRETGDISELSIRAIEKAALWDGEPRRFFNALLDCRFIDGQPDNDTDPLRVHGWAEYYKPLIERRKSQAAASKRYRERKRNDTSSLCVNMTHEHKDQDRNPDRNPDQLPNIMSTTSNMSNYTTPRDLYAYFQKAYPNNTHPNFSFFEALFEAGFEGPAIKFLIDACAGTKKPSAYFDVVCRDKQKRKLFTLDDLKADEKAFQEQKATPSRP